MDFAQKGDYFRYYKTRDSISEKEAVLVLYQLLKALDYIHSMDIIHRDVKLENLLIDKDHKIKLCDFGWCSDARDNKRNILCGTYEYMAPEVVKSQYYGCKVDIWSLGVVAFELIHKHSPFKSPDREVLLSNITRGNYYIDSSVTEIYSSFIRSCLEVNPINRSSASELLQHPIFDDVKHNMLSRSTICDGSSIIRKNYEAVFDMNASVLNNNNRWGVIDNNKQIYESNFKCDPVVEEKKNLNISKPLHDTEYKIELDPDVEYAPSLNNGSYIELDVDPYDIIDNIKNYCCEWMVYFENVFSDNKETVKDEKKFVDQKIAIVTVNNKNGDMEERYNDTLSIPHESRPRQFITREPLPPSTLFSNNGGRNNNISSRINVSKTINNSSNIVTAQEDTVEDKGIFSTLFDILGFTSDHNHTKEKLKEQTNKRNK